MATMPRRQGFFCFTSYNASAVKICNQIVFLLQVGFAGSCFCHPKAFCHRLIALALMCLLGFGSYFCFDNPGALQVNPTVDFIYQIGRNLELCGKKSYLLK
jgi:hypothetical protein